VATGDTSSCCGRNGGRDRPTRSYPTKHCYWSRHPRSSRCIWANCELRLTSLTGNVPLADWLEAKTGLPTVLANDANCAGLAEAWLGAGRQFRNLILLTLGTGVGGAIILDRKLFIGHQGTAGELGLITLNPDGPECNSGNQGSFEQYVSAPAIRRRTGLEPAELRSCQSRRHKCLDIWQT